MFVAGDAHAIPLSRTFDVIILSDLANELWDVQRVLTEVTRLSSSQTRIILNTYSRLWQVPLALTKRLNLSKPVLDQNWLTLDDLRNLLRLSGLEPIRSWQEILMPLRLPPFDVLLNRVAAHIWPFSQLALANFMVGRRAPSLIRGRTPTRYRWLFPPRNEAGNIASLVARMPKMGSSTELIFVEGHSSDDTFHTIETLIAEGLGLPCRLLQQAGQGKGDAVRCGFEAAEGEILMILDADLSVPPEDLLRFYNALTTGVGEFINGVRMVYPMEPGAMRGFNLVGNKAFSQTLSWVLGQPVKDTLCGTKVLWKRDYQRISRSRGSTGGPDPFGDFELLLGAARRSLRIVDLPVRYRSRTYGSTNIDRWRHGCLLRVWHGLARRD